MDERKPKFSTKTALCCALLLIALCVLTVGTATFARYAWEFAQTSYQFVPESRRAVSLYNGHLTGELVESGTLSPVSGMWEQTDSGAAIEFSVANGTPEEFAKEDSYFTVSISAGLAVEDPGALTVSISYPDENGRTVTVTATPERIAEGSMQQTAFGDGWVYRFLEGEDELRFLLKGNAFYYENFTVTVTGDVPATLLDLQVTQLNE